MQPAHPQYEGLTVDDHILRKRERDPCNRIQWLFVCSILSIGKRQNKRRATYHSAVQETLQEERANRKHEMLGVKLISRNTDIKIESRQHNYHKQKFGCASQITCFVDFLSGNKSINPLQRKIWYFSACFNAHFLCIR